MHETPSQTIGPFHHVALVRDGPDQLVDRATPGAIIVRGTAIDGDGAPVTDALIEVWQADADGRYPDGATEPRFTGFGRVATDERGAFSIVTVKPGGVGGEAPHLNLTVFARGLLAGLSTRVYFDDEPDANAADPVLGRIDADRRDTLLARGDGDGYVFDLRLQGPRETVFLAF